MAGRDQHGRSSEAQRLRQARARLEHGGDRGRARHTGVSGINSQVGDSQGQSLDQKMLSLWVLILLKLWVQEDGQGTILALTYPLVCPSAIHRCCRTRLLLYTCRELRLQSQVAALLLELCQSDCQVW